MLLPLDVPSLPPALPAPGTMTTSQAPMTPSTVGSATPRGRMDLRMEGVLLGRGRRRTMRWFHQMSLNVTPQTLTGKCCHLVNSKLSISHREFTTNVNFRNMVI